MCRIIWSSVACPVLPYFPTLSHKWHDFWVGGGRGWGKSLNIKCVFWFSQELLPQTFLILSRIQRDMCTGLHVEYPLFLSYFKWNLYFLDKFLKRNPQISDLMEIRPVVPELFHADGRTDMTRLIVAFRNFANATKNWLADGLAGGLTNQLINFALQNIPSRYRIFIHATEYSFTLQNIPSHRHLYIANFNSLPTPVCQKSSLQCLITPRSVMESSSSS
jgi:hypothetical protein